MTTVASDYRRILIVATRQIGDVLCTTPLMRRARELWPNATIDVLGYEKTTGMLAGNSDINEVIESPEHPRWPEYTILLKKIYRRYNLAVVAQPSDRAHLYGLLAAPKRVGVIAGAHHQVWWKRLFSAHVVERNLHRQHMVIEGLRLLTPFEVGSIARQVSVIPPRPLTDRPLAVTPVGAYVVIHPCSLGKFKLWPAKYWVFIIRALLTVNLHVVLTGSGSPHDQLVIRAILARLDDRERGSVLDVSGKLSLSEMSNLIKGAALFLGVDTSVTHQAAAIGVKTVALYGPTNPVNFGPWPAALDVSTLTDWYAPWKANGDGEGSLSTQICKNVLLVQGRQNCVPCMQKGCERRDDSKSECLESIEPADLLLKLKAFLNVN